MPLQSALRFSPTRNDGEQINLAFRLEFNLRQPHCVFFAQDYLHLDLWRKPVIKELKSRQSTHY